MVQRRDPLGHQIHAVVDATTQIDIKPPRLTKQGVVAGRAAAMPVAGGVVLGIRLRFHHHAPQLLASGLALHQQASDEVGGNLLGGEAEEGLGEAGRCWMGVVAMGVVAMGVAL